MLFFNWEQFQNCEIELNRADSTKMVSKSLPFYPNDVNIKL